MNTAILVGMLLFAAAAVLDLLPRPVRGSAWHAALPYLLCAGGSGCLAAVGALALRGEQEIPRLGFGQWLGFGDSGLAVDRLSGLFWLLTFAVAVGACLTAGGWAPGRPAGRGPAAYAALLLASVAVVESADNVFLFLLAWESLTLAFYLLTAAERRRTGAALATVGFGKASGAALMLGMLLASARTGSFALPGFTHLQPGAVHSAVWVLLVTGFVIKVGLVPVQVWMPRGYAAAPAGLRQLMAGVAVNAGFYGLWRTLELLGRPPVWLAVTLLILASLTALLGIAHAAVQGRLERVIAYSSVENAGLICTGYAVALIGACRDNARLTAVGLIAATLQIVAHAVAKTLLFAGAAGLESDTGTGDLERLRGAGRRSPWSGVAVAAGAVTLAGLPPTTGFVSEWFLLESLMQQFRLPHLPYALAFAVAGALVALTAGFASVTFVRVVGMIVLGPRTEDSKGAVSRHADLGPTGRAGVLVLTVGGLALAALTPLEIRVLARGLRDLVAAPTSRGALKSPWVVQPVFADFSILSPTWLWIMMPSLLLAVVAVLLIGASRGSALRVRRTPAWRSASSGVHGDDQYTPFGYANPTRRVLAGVLRTRTSTGAGPTKAPASAPPEPTTTVATSGVLHYSSDVVEVVETYVYRPLLRPLRALVITVKRLQSGHLDAYLAYMLIVLVALLAVVAGLA
ncbi:Formate hydrogenlyase subunit 3/Multisubunit Na+/H+ antiporter, MnhD subunit [Actinacidiphila alni]|uniref:Formate hydrogenlyase subunit 3/Multisubunit Na+/H+ antiporter, MnhD subunit n=1 Tax=Actinacidiphila alni TaxID=380248 RepID=A0A1I2ARZ0_9ACTN|nr:proton-conducting transporter membrane subunit [Actinacidiphila alni]SFE46764.1 Formate hydrogenlyase subunit 3/Multisubunit Na+/H+ antiporter, MnhD subunit [Actinacidiphila alni]